MDEILEDNYYRPLIYFYPRIFVLTYSVIIDRDINAAINIQNEGCRILSVS
ncbi:hypothetical protein [Clostridium aceticum]|uniref:hypothetical protein n=1 Tax=Clostridium aceticum TaxID=84022 RepID=UPI000B156905|nr:hypothetical protein [Clostridium aceticum]